MSAQSADRTPLPSLTYSGWASRDWRPDPEGVVSEPGQPRLYSISEITVWMHGELRVVLHGPMRKRDGTRGAHSRGALVDLGHQQPDWLAFLIRDARRRLSAETRAER